jgi:hypothetical protein
MNIDFFYKNDHKIKIQRFSLVYFYLKMIQDVLWNVLKLITVLIYLYIKNDIVFNFIQFVFLQHFNNIII